MYQTIRDPFGRVSRGARQKETHHILGPSFWDPNRVQLITELGSDCLEFGSALVEFDLAAFEQRFQAAHLANGTGAGTKCTRGALDSFNIAHDTTTKRSISQEHAA